MKHNWIIDASMLIQAYIADPHTKRVNTLLDRLLKGTDDIHIPEFCMLECTNILWKRVVFNQLPKANVEIAVRQLKLLPLTFTVLSPC